MRFYFYVSCCIAFSFLSFGFSGKGPVFPREAFIELEGKPWYGSVTQLNAQTGETVSDSVILTVSSREKPSNTWSFDFSYPNNAGCAFTADIQWAKKGKEIGGEMVVESSITKSGQYYIVTLNQKEDKEFRHTYQISPFHFVHSIAVMKRENDKFLPDRRYELSR